MTNLVLRELPESLWRELRQAQVLTVHDGSADVEVAFERNGPLMRAFLRAQAELLVADALAMEAGTYVERDKGQREYEAMQLILHRLRAVQPTAA